ncbi:unnamed protein product [Ixodes pacificus]
MRRWCLPVRREGTVPLQGERGREAVRPLSGRRLLARGEQPSRLHRVLHVRSLGTLQSGQHGLGPGVNTPKGRDNDRGRSRAGQSASLQSHTRDAAGLNSAARALRSGPAALLVFARPVPGRQGDHTPLPRGEPFPGRVPRGPAAPVPAGVPAREPPHIARPPPQGTLRDGLLLRAPSRGRVVPSGQPAYSGDPRHPDGGPPEPPEDFDQGHGRSGRQICQPRRRLPGDCGASVSTRGVAVLGLWHRTGTVPLSVYSLLLPGSCGGLLPQVQAQLPGQPGHPGPRRLRRALQLQQSHPRVSQGDRRLHQLRRKHRGGPLRTVRRGLLWDAVARPLFAVRVPTSYQQFQQHLPDSWTGLYLHRLSRRLHRKAL